ncbi:MAG: ATP-binding cassette domain-containing protein [Armatimonadetes bacterium]|nr:ATP-binding cassette domain-containing protein [Armatimonadota bacterium]
MSLLTVRGLEIAFGVDVLFSDVSFTVGRRQKIGLVGRNGCGKTTLLRIVCGLTEPDRGRVEIHGRTELGYLRQEPNMGKDRTVREEAENAFQHILDLEQRMAKAAERMASSDEAVEEYGALRERFDAMGGYDALRDIPTALRMLGFSLEDQGKRVSMLSGGEKTRLGLAKLLLNGPDLMILDEPTNHLDLKATEWLEGYLKGFGGGLIVVSHDRYFLDRVCTHIADLERGRLTLFAGNYSNFVQQKELRKQQDLERYEREQAEIARLELFFEQWKNTPSKRSQAVMRKRWAERIKKTAIEKPPGAQKSMAGAVKSIARSATEVVRTDDLGMAFGNRALFSGLSFRLERGEKLGVIGPNGAGKTTLIKILLGEIEPTSGRVKIGGGVSIGYYAQEASGLDFEATVLENMLDAAPMRAEEARNHLGRFLFSGEDAFKPVSALSGGEKNKLALAQLTYASPNLLILDEPTNHLDAESREALKEMLIVYPGTVILISHDRYLLDQVTQATLAIEDGNAELYPAPYSEYKARARPVERPQVARATDGLNFKQLAKERSRALTAVEKAEKRVAEIEDRLRACERALANPQPGDSLYELTLRHGKITDELQAAIGDWETAVKHAEDIGAN